MKLSLEVTSQGNAQNKVIPITVSQFVIGRDPKCQLRPASPLISNRHCALLVRSGKVYLHDYGSTNGTFINDEPVQGEIQLRNQDRLKVGPISFIVRIEAAAPVNKPTPAPAPARTPAPASVAATAPTRPAAAAAPDDDESIAAMLLSLQDDGSGPASNRPRDPDGVPQGSTVMDIPSPLRQEEETGKPGEAKPGAKKKDSPKPSGNTSSAAKDILEKYTRRQRG